MEIAQTGDIEPHYQPLIEMARGGSAKMRAALPQVLNTLLKTRFILPEVFFIGIRGDIVTRPDVALGPDGEADGFKSRYVPEIGLLGPTIGGRVIYPEVF